MKKVLITGIAGFAGSHLAQRLSGRFEVWGALLDDNTENLSGIDGLHLLKCDLLDTESVKGLVAMARPERIFHLAAQSAPSVAISSPADTLRVNIFSTLNLFEAVASAAPGARFLNVGSGDEYGDVSPEELPVRETAELRPTNPYSVSKVAQDMLGFQYFKSRGLKVMRVRPFNHYGPRQSDRFVASAFARQIAEIEAGAKADRTLKVGCLDAAKDFLDVRDVVSAYDIIMEKGEPGFPYNVASGRAVRIREILDALLSLSSAKIEVVEDPQMTRRAETKVIYGDCSRLKALGWSPGHSLADGLSALLDYWRRRAGAA